MSILGNWTNKGPTMSRPKFSDSEGNVELMKEDFVAPPGWKWNSDWHISPELRYMSFTLYVLDEKTYNLRYLLSCFC